MTTTEDATARIAISDRPRLGQLLVRAGIVTDGQLAEALEARQWRDSRRERLGQALVRLGFAEEAEIARSLSEQMGLAYLEGDALRPEPAAVRLVSAALAHRYRVLPLSTDEDGTLTVASADPTDVVGRDDLRTATGVRRIVTRVASGTEIDEAIRRSYGFEQAGDLIGAIEVDDEEDVEAELAEDGPMIKLVDGMIADAIDRDASDIHVEPGTQGARVRLRIDGVLQEGMTVPRNASGQFVARLKLMASMDIAERRLPQDGRARFRVGGQEVDLRVSSLPSMYGETIVVRLLRKGAERLSLHEVGLEEEQLARLHSVIERPQGLVLITGPTGSGKTSTLYAALGQLAQATRNVITLEDPVEYELEGVNQTQIHDRIGRTFARCLRTVLRQDPDVVMVGEIRDRETAELALQASMTGHLVLSTLHTNDAPSAVMRLRDLGVPPYLIAGSLTMVIAQRLVRRVCSRCAVDAEPSERHAAQLHLAPRELARMHLRTGAGCTHCGRTGYRGRLGLFEVLPVDLRIRDLLVSNGSTSELRRAARDGGMRSLRESGLRRVAEGVTTLEELVRVAPAELEQDDGSCPVCAHVVQPQFAHCPFCGTRLGLPTCGSCERVLEFDWRVCPDCGTGNDDPADAPSATVPRVLVVDDDPSVRKAVAAMLTDEYEVLEAADGPEAISCALTQRPDVVLLDVGLPGQDGYAVTRALRARMPTRDLPVVLITGSDEPSTELDGLAAGADDYLTKPLAPEELLARLAAVRRRVARR